MLHFTTRREWDRARGIGRYEPDAMAAEGFIHLSFGHQLARAAALHAPEGEDLVVLVVDPAGLEDRLRIEGGFPHLYRPVPTTAVRHVAAFAAADDGTYAIPEPARLAELALTALPSFDAVMARCRAVMAGFGGPWWIGGGWAADAGAGTIHRPHLDIDVIALRPDVAELGRHLRGGTWDLRLAGSGTLTPWAGGPLAPEAHQVWVRPDDGFRPERWQDFAADPAFFEILVEQVDGGEWTYRRDASVRAPLDRLGPPGGFLRTEVALLYKAPTAVGDDVSAASKAEQDFRHTVGHLERDAAAWLRAAIARCHPAHPWLGVLS